MLNHWKNIIFFLLIAENTIFIIMLWVLIESFLLKRFQWVPTAYIYVFMKNKQTNNLMMVISF